MTDRRLRGSPALRGCAMAALGAFLAVAQPAPPAAAQTSQVQELVNRIERLQSELNTLQSFVYRGQRPPAPAPGATAVPGGDSGNPAVVAGLSVRLSQLEGEIRRLTGQNEEFGHSIRQMRARLDKLVTDVDTRLAALERRTGVAPGGQPSEPGAADPPTPLPPGPPSGSLGPGQTPQALGPGAQVLGQLRVDPATGQALPGPTGGAAPAPAPPQRQQAARPPETPEQMYDRAQTLLLKEQNFDEAERVLRSFLERHPKHQLAANAHYWLGRSYFVRQDYQQAANAFADALQKYPKSDKAPDNWLNLGMSLARLGKNKEACTAYQAVQQHFPRAEDRIKRRIATERQRAKCG